jgi:hypothetical protein
METQESSDITESINREPNVDFESVDSPIVTSLTTPYPHASGSVRGKVNSLRKIQEQEQELKKQQ